MNDIRGEMSDDERDEGRERIPQTVSTTGKCKCER